MRNIPYVAIAAATAIALPLAAQNTCTGPGSAFGIVSYQCGDCTIDQTPDALPKWQFGVEPLVLKTTAGSLLQSGDIVEAVSGTPITTAAGATLFTYPAARDSLVTVRRGGQRTTLHTHTAGDCARAAETMVQLQQLRHALELQHPLKYDTLIVLNQARYDSLITAYHVIVAHELQSLVQAAEKHRDRFGFAIACTDCTHQVLTDGTPSWIFKSNPMIGVVDSTGPAARAGLRTGDVILTVNGNPVLEEAGSDALARSNEATTLSLTVQHKDGTRLTVQLKARDVKPK